MKQVTLFRHYRGADCTLGVLRIEDDVHEPIYTLEMPWLNNEVRRSCIPTGQYRCSPHSGARFKDVWHLHNVPNRSAILIHQGNTVKDIQGCILFGLSVGNATWVAGAPRAVTQSVKAISHFKQFIKDTDDFILTIL